MNKVIKVFFVNSRHDLFLFVSFIIKIMIYPYNMKQYLSYIQEFEGVTSTCVIPNLLLQLQTWGITCQNTCDIEVHSCKQVLYFLSLPLDNKSFSVRPGVKWKLGAKCKAGTANWGWNVDWVETVLTIEFKREWEKKTRICNLLFILYICN